MATYERNHPSRVHREADAVALETWQKWDLDHMTQARSVELTSTTCVCGHRATDHNNDGCMRYGDGEFINMPCPCDCYQRAHY